MKHILNHGFLVFLFLFGWVASSLGRQLISATDSRLALIGSLYTFDEGEKRIPQRHSSEVLALPSSESGFSSVKAQTTTGVVLAFRSDSLQLRIVFEALEGENRGSEFGVYENGILIHEQRFAKSDTEMILEFASQDEGLSTFEISLPSWSKVAFRGLEIDDHSSLKAYDRERKTYVAFGDSISHGTGQGSASYKTWPFLLSRKLDTDLYNLAVGGGKVSIPSAALLRNLDQIDLITLLVGYNDLNTGISPGEFAERYKTFLRHARAAKPNAAIYCISPLYTRTVKSRRSEYTMDAFREAMYSVVEELAASDERLFLIKGHEITSERNLRENSSDPVHLGIEGAAMLAEELAKIIGEAEE